MTDYQATGYARRFARARAFDSTTQAVWVAELCRLAGPTRLATVVDLGAGTGRFWPILREAWQSECIIAIDKSSRMLAAADTSSDVHTIVGDIDDLPDFGEVDGGLCSMVLHYSRDPVAVCRRLYSAIRPGGLLCIRTATQENIGAHGFLRYFPTAQAAERAVMPTLEAVIGWLIQAGFTSVQTKWVTTVPARSYPDYLGSVASRGFPSLQLVPAMEFWRGFGRLTIACATRRLRQRTVPADHTLLVSAVRP
ncbi:MAG: class I SAM-dependent methyltransferase [Alphaproteobacteria bacterium]|nr:class I SAM-dependent methyltransferase [Alphaproteobacteria bacterium]MBU2379521.1 class I SAM-dependent methyltransferase [Alphaproteobacteria bacterium]